MLTGALVVERVTRVELALLAPGGAVRVSTGQKSIDSLFAPLADLSEPRRNAVTEILATHLDLGGSVSRTAEATHLHRNAVRARLSRAYELLSIDPDDPDQRLFLQGRGLPDPHPAHATGANRRTSIARVRVSRAQANEVWGWPQPRFSAHTHNGSRSSLLKVE